MMYAALAAIKAIIPEGYATEAYGLALWGIDPDAYSADVSTPIGAGQAVAKATIDYYLSDPMNPTGERPEAKRVDGGP